MSNNHVLFFVSSKQVIKCHDTYFCFAVRLSILKSSMQRKVFSAPNSLVILSASSKTPFSSYKHAVLFSWLPSRAEQLSRCTPICCDTFFLWQASSTFECFPGCGDPAKYFSFITATDKVGKVKRCIAGKVRAENVGQWFSNQHAHP